MSGNSDELFNQLDHTCTPLSSLVRSQENFVPVTSTIPGHADLMAWTQLLVHKSLYNSLQRLPTTFNA